MDEATKRRLKRERRARADARQAERKGKTPAGEPTVRLFPNPVTVPGTEAGPRFPILIPDPAKREGEGRRALRAIVERLQAAAGVNALLAHGHLMAAHAGRADRHELATTSVAGRASLTPDYLLRRGREELVSLRLEGADFDRLVTLSFAGPEHGLTKDPEKLAAVHLEALSLLTSALDRAQRVIAANDAAFTIANDKTAGEEVLRAYRHGKATIGRRDLVNIAALADVNPAPLWPQHAQFMTPVLEVARFGGKLVKASRRGGRSELDRRLFPALRLVLGQGGAWPESADAEAAFLSTARLVGACVDIPDLLLALKRLDDLGADLVLGEPRA